VVVPKPLPLPLGTSLALFSVLRQVLATGRFDETKVRILEKHL